MTETVLTAILAVFTAIGNWIVETIPSFFPLFYNAESGLTFMGVLAVVGLAFSVVFLLIGIVQKFLHFRGAVQISVLVPAFLEKFFVLFG